MAFPPTPGRILCPDDHPDRWSPDPSKRGEAFAAVNRALRDEVLVDPAVRRVLVLVGPPGSGKSTYAAALANDPRGPGLLGPAAVLIDACHAVKATRAALAKRIRAAGKEAIAIVMVTPVETCVAQDAARPPPRRVGRETIEQQARALRASPVVRSEGWSSILQGDPSRLLAQGAA